MCIFLKKIATGTHILRNHSFFGPHFCVSPELPKFHDVFFEVFFFENGRTSFPKACFSTGSTLQ